AWMAARPPGVRGLVAPARPPRMDRHCARHLLASLAPLSIDLAWDASPLRITPLVSDEILVHAGSGSPSKNWPAENVAAVIRQIDAPVRLIVGEADAPATNAVEHALGHPLPHLEHPEL